MEGTVNCVCIFPCDCNLDNDSGLSVCIILGVRLWLWWCCGQLLTVLVFFLLIVMMMVDCLLTIPGDFDNDDRLFVDCVMFMIVCIFPGDSDDDCCVCISRFVFSWWQWRWLFVFFLEIVMMTVDCCWLYFPNDCYYTCTCYTIMFVYFLMIVDCIGCWLLKVIEWCGALYCWWLF